MLPKEVREAAAEHGKKFAQAKPAIDATMEQQAGLLQAMMDDIGMDHSLSIQIAGMHLGSVVGGGCDLGIDPKRWPDALISLYSGGEWERWLLGDRDSKYAAEYVGAVKEISRACMSIVDRCIVLTVPDHAKAMRQYLELLSSLVGQSCMAAQGD